MMSPRRAVGRHEPPVMPAGPEDERVWMILVTGATGMFGSRVVRCLAEGGHDVRALMHSPENGEALRGLHVEPAIGDMDDPSSLARALEGVEVVFLVSPMDDQIAVRERNTIAAAKAAGVQRVVKLYGCERLTGRRPMSVEQFI